MPRQTALLGVLPPLLIAAVFLLIAWRPWKEGSAVSAARGPTLGALGLAVAYAVVDQLQRGWSGWWPTEEFRRLPAVGIAAALGVAVVAQLGRLRGPWTWLGTLGVMTACVAMVAAWRGWWVVGGAAAAAALIDRGAALAATRPGGSVRTLPALTVAAVAVAVVCVQSSSAIFALMAGAVATATGVAALIAAWRPDRPVVRGFGTVHAALLIGLLLTLGSITWPARGLAAAAMLAPWLAAAPALARRHWMLGAAACAVASAGMGVLAVWATSNGLDFDGL